MFSAVSPSRQPESSSVHAFFAPTPCSRVFHAISLFLSRAGVIDGFPRERFECGPWAGPARARRASLDARYGLLRRVGTIEWCRLAHLLRRLRDETDSHAMDAGLSTAQQFEM